MCKTTRTLQKALKLKWFALCKNRRCVIFQSKSVYLSLKKNSMFFQKCHCSERLPVFYLENSIWSELVLCINSCVSVAKKRSRGSLVPALSDVERWGCEFRSFESSLCDVKNLVHGILSQGIVRGSSFLSSSGLRLVIFDR